MEESGESEDGRYHRVPFERCWLGSRTGELAAEEGVLEHGYWLPGGSLVPTVIVTSHAGVRERGDLQALRQALLEHQHP